MSSTTTRSVASGVLGTELPAGVADIAWRLAGPKQSMRMPSPVSPPLAISSAKTDGWPAAVTHAMSATDPDILARLAKDSRKQVRRTVAANWNTDVETQGYLFGWALAKDDCETFSALFHRIELGQLIGLVAAHTVASVSASADGDVWDTLATRLRNSTEPRHITRAVSLENAIPLHAAIARHKGCEQVPGLGINDLMAQYPATDVARRTALTWQAMQADHHMGPALARHFVDYLVPQDGSRKWEGIHTAPADAVDILLESDSTAALTIAARTAASPEQLDQVIAANNRAALIELMNRGLVGLSAAQASRVVWALNGPADCTYNASPYFAVSVTDRLAGPRIPDEDFVALLRHGSRDITERWLAGRLAYQPEPGQVAALVTTPGTAFSAPAVHYDYRRQRPSTPPTRDEIARSLTETLATIADELWMDELVEALSASFFARIPDRTPIATYFVNRLKAGIGVSPDAWELAFSLLDSFEGSLDHLMSTTRRLMKTSGIGIVPAPAVDPEPAGLAQFSFMA